MKRCFLFCLPLFILIVAFVYFVVPKNSLADATKNITGFAWSDTTGWISFNNSSSGDLTPYGVNYDSTTGYLTGFAWSSNIGWIKFGGLSGFPTGSGTTADNTKINSTTGVVTGWARACAGTYDGVCGGGTYTYTPPPVISTTTTFTWTQRTSGHTFDSIAISSDGTKLAATSYGNYIYTSVDSGATWTARTSAGSRNWYFISSSADGTKLAAVENNGHIFVSSNSGATWAQTSAVSGNWTYIASSADGTKLAAVNKDSYLYTSADSGATWTARTSAGQRSWFTIASSADGTKLIAGVFNDVPTVPGTGYLYTSTDSGTTWTQRTGAGKRMWYSVSSSSDGNKLVAVSNDGSIYTSADSGSTWISQTSSSGQGWFHVSSSSDGSVIVASPYSGYIYVSTDSGVTWTKQSSPGSVGWQSLVSSSDGTRFAAGVNGSYVWTSSSSITTISTPQPSTTTDSRLDGWDGWISLSGSNYGVTYASTTGYFSGFAWGSDVLGWISFNNSSSGDSTIYAVKGPSSAPVPDAPVVTTGSTVSSSCSGTNPSVSISFDLVTGASSYKLYRCDSSNSNCSPLFSQTTSPVTDVITNNVSATYYYHLTSVNSSGTESVPSSSIQANVTACVLNPVNTQSFKTNPSTINVVGGKCNFIVNLVNTPDSNAECQITDTLSGSSFMFYPTSTTNNISNSLTVSQETRYKLVCWENDSFGGKTNITPAMYSTCYTAPNFKEVH